MEEKQKRTADLKCPNKKCGHEWTYHGVAKFYACCPRCHYLVKLPQKNEGGVKNDRN